jgi:hypothetical protein
LAVGELVLTAVNLGTAAPSGLRARPGDLPVTVALLMFALVGVVVASRRPRNAIGWLLIAEGLAWAAGLFCEGYVTYAAHTRPRSLPLPELAATVVASIWVPAIMLIPLVLLRPPIAGAVTSAVTLTPIYGADAHVSARGGAVVGCRFAGIEPLDAQGFHADPGSADAGVAEPVQPELGSNASFQGGPTSIVLIPAPTVVRRHKVPSNAFSVTSHPSGHRRGVGDPGGADRRRPRDAAGVVGDRVSGHALVGGPSPSRPLADRSRRGVHDGVAVLARCSPSATGGVPAAS